MQKLAILFGSAPRVKLLRLFVFNPDQGYERADVCRRARITVDTARRELSSLQRLGLIKRKKFYKTVPQRAQGDVETTKKRATGWGLDTSFVYLEPLRRFLLDTLLLSDKDIAGRLKSIGSVKLMIAGGIFVGEWEQRLDLLIVGERINDQKLTNAIRSLEAEVGHEIRYAVFTTEDLKYRLRVYDRLMRDVFDYEHRVIIDKLGYFN